MGLAKRARLVERQDIVYSSKIDLKPTSKKNKYPVIGRNSVGILSEDHRAGDVMGERYRFRSQPSPCAACGEEAEPLPLSNHCWLLPTE